MARMRSGRWPSWLVVALGAILTLGACRSPKRSEPPAATEGKTGAARSSPALDLPPALAPYRDALEPSVKTFVRVAGAPGPVKPWESKLGGAPYLPRGAKVPHDPRGRPMRLLAQINFAEVPDVGLFPRRGLLQFFLSAADEAYGLDFDDATRQRGFRVVFFEEVVQDPARLARPPDVASGDAFPLGTKEVRLSFSVERAPVSLDDFRAEALLPRALRETDALAEAYAERFPAGGHKLGGYPFFTQSDPRDGERGKHAPLELYDVLLLQLDSDDALDLMWGDAGVANFFIREQDLRRGSFADVLYHWDCY